MNCSPLLHQVVMLLAWSSRKEMSTALEAELAVLGEADRGIGSVDLLLQHDMTACNGLELDLTQILVTRLKTRPLYMRGARIFLDCNVFHNLTL